MPTVLGVSASPFVRKVRVALAEKNIPYDLVPIFPQAQDEEFRKLSPLGKVPAFKDGDKGFSDSSHGRMQPPWPRARGASMTIQRIDKRLDCCR